MDSFMFHFTHSLEHIPAPAIPQPAERDTREPTNQPSQPVNGMRSYFKNSFSNDEISKKSETKNPHIDDNRPFFFNAFILRFDRFFTHMIFQSCFYFLGRFASQTTSTTMPTSGKPITSSIIKKPKPIIMISIPAYSTIKNMRLTLKASGYYFI